MYAFRNSLTIVIFGLLFFFPVFAVCFKIGGGGVVQDPDVWWHLRTADWIVEHGAVPQFDTFAAPQQGTPWVDYSWAAQLVLRGFHNSFGERGLVIYTALLDLAIVLVFQVMVRRMQQNLLVSAVLTLAATIGMQALATPRPWLFSMLFFLIELHLLLEAGRTGHLYSGRPRLLLVLVPLFWVWANVHIQFTLGLLVLAAAVVEPLLARWVPLPWDGESAAVSPRWLLAVFVLCCGATLLNPYHVRVYSTAAQLLGQAELWNWISELRAMPFRSVIDWVVLAAALSGAAAIAARRPVRLLLVLLFPLAVYFSFRARRDQWFVLFVGLALAASMSRGLPLAPTRLTARGRWGAAALLTVLVLCAFLTLNESQLEADVARDFPAQAVAFVGQGSYDGPLYNTYTWGGYLMYFCPQHPVSIDGRTLVHGADRVIHCLKIQHGDDDWQSDPELAAAGLVILPRGEPLALLLRLDPRFQVVFDDDVAVVFVRR